MNIHRLYARILLPFRRRRMRRFQRAFAATAATRVLDSGGSLFNWGLLAEPPDLVLLNVLAPESFETRGVKSVIADGCRLPFRDDAFEIVFSNSVIEHLGSRDNQRRFAVECRRAGRGYFVQTPNRRFPFEPHLLTPFVHWLPLAARRRLIRNFTVRGILGRPSKRWCTEFVESTRLLGRKEMAELFPDANLVDERFLGMAKAIVAMRPGPVTKARTR